jgi:predicted nucleic acid-binding protein
MFAIDANIFIEISLSQKNSLKCESFLRKVRDGKINAVVSDFTVCGITIVLERCGKSWEDIRTFLVSLLHYKGLMIYSSSLADKINATTLMKKYSLDFEDSLTLQCALAAGANSLVSYDKDFGRVSEISLVTPSDVT